MDLKYQNQIMKDYPKEIDIKQLRERPKNWDIVPSGKEADDLNKQYGEMWDRVSNEVYQKAKPNLRDNINF